MKKTNNKGFSLVELIVVIAIMAVLVGVAAPTFIKYVDQSRRATDIQNAQTIESAILAAIADGELDTDVATATAFTATTVTTLTTAPVVSSDVIGTRGDAFTVVYDVTNGTCSVYPNNTTYDLTEQDDADTYKNLD